MKRTNTKLIVSRIQFETPAPESYSNQLFSSSVSWSVVKSPPLFSNSVTKNCVDLNVLKVLYSSSSTSVSKSILSPVLRMT